LNRNCYLLRIILLLAEVESFMAVAVVK